MNQPLRDLLRQGADSVERPQLDVGQLIGEAERRLRRRRMATVSASTLAVTLIVAGAFALRPSDRLTPDPPVPVNTPGTPEPTPARGQATYFAAPPDDVGDPLRGWFVEIGGQSDLYLHRAGEAPRRVMSTKADERCPAVSPDGANLAYLSGPHTADGLAVGSVVVMALDNAGDPEPGSRRVILRDARPGCPQWSPDGRTLALTTEGDDWSTTELHAVTLEGADRVLAVLQPYASQFAWSPEGDSVAYLTEDAVWIAPLAGGEPELFWRSTPSPDTSPQGRPLPGAPTALWWLRTGELAVVVLSDRVEDVWPNMPEGPSILHVIDLESERHETTTLSFESPYMGGQGGVWSPDGSRFAVGSEDGSRILVHDRATGLTLTPRLRLDDGQRFFINLGERVWINGVSWSADGDRLLTDAQRGSDSEGGPFARVSIPLDGTSVEVLSPWEHVGLPR
jgi:hypothetical protein